MNELQTLQRELADDLHLLHHALGIKNPDRPGSAPYRNHFVAGPGHSDMTAPEYEELRQEEA